MPNAADTITFPKGPLPESYYTADRGAILIGVASGFIVLELAAFSLRTISRHMHRVAFGWDDALVIPALMLNLLVCILAICKLINVHSNTYLKHLCSVLTVHEWLSLWVELVSTHLLCITKIPENSSS